MKSTVRDRPPYAPEIEYLLAYVCPSSRADADALVSQQVQNNPLSGPQSLDWPCLLRQAAQQGVLLRLYHALQPAAIQAIPSDVQQALQQTAQALTVRNWQLTKALVQLLSSFAEADIPAIPFKGPTLTQTLYGDLAQREFVDLDLLVPASHAEAVREHLAHQGYQSHHDNPWSCVFIKPGAPEIDLHWQLAPPCFSYQLDVPALLPRCQSINLFSQPILTLTPEDSVVALSVQITKDCHFNRIRLIQLCDFAVLIRCSTLNWNDVLQRVTDQGTVRLLHFALRLIHVVCQEPLPSGLTLPPDAIATRYVQQVAASLFSTAKNQEGVFGLLEGGFQAKVYGSLLRGLLLKQPGTFTARDWALLQHFAGYLLTPNARDSTAMQQAGAAKLPISIVRPLRLVGKFLRFSSG